MEKLMGIYGLLYTTPTWITAMLLYFFCINILFIMRDWFEKMPYNISVASQQGDLALIGYILIGVEILKRQTYFPAWITNETFYSPVFSSPAIAIIIIATGCVYHFAVISKPDKHQTIADTYHNIVIVPLLAILIILISLVTGQYGTDFEKAVSICCLLVWLITMHFDAEQDRFQQTKWLIVKGIPNFLHKAGYRYEIKPLIEGRARKD